RRHGGPAGCHRGGGGVARDREERAAAGQARPPAAHLSLLAPGEDRPGPAIPGRPQPARPVPVTLAERLPSRPARGPAGRSFAACPQPRREKLPGLPAALREELPGRPCTPCRRGCPPALTTPGLLPFPPCRPRRPGRLPGR